MNTTGQILIDTCIATGLRIVNGRIGSDEGIGMNTCITCRGGSVVDYVLVQSDLLTHICKFEVYGPILCSDHSPINFIVA